jgi:hypothetical protein
MENMKSENPTSGSFLMRVNFIPAWALNAGICDLIVAYVDRFYPNKKVVLYKIDSGNGITKIVDA